MMQRRFFSTGTLLGCFLFLFLLSDSKAEGVREGNFWELPNVLRKMTYDYLGYEDARKFQTHYDEQIAEDIQKFGIDARPKVLRTFAELCALPVEVKELRDVEFYRGASSTEWDLVRILRDKRLRHVNRLKINCSRVAWENMNPFEIEKVAPYFSELSELQSVTFLNCSGPVGLEVLLSMNPSLESLYLFQKLDRADIAGLVAGLREHQGLITLGFQGLDDMDPNEPSYSEDLFEAAGESPSLRQIFVRMSKLKGAETPAALPQSRGAFALLNAFNRSKTLQELTIESSWADPTGYKMIKTAQSEWEGEKSQLIELGYDEESAFKSIKLNQFRKMTH